jgi:hypothetical protein
MQKDLVSEYFMLLEGKIKKLADERAQILAENSRLSGLEVYHLKTIEEQNKQIELLTSQVQALKIAKSVEHNQETGKVKDKIQDLVREIDRCIELLNK